MPDNPRLSKPPPRADLASYFHCERKGKNSPNLDKRINVFLQVFGNINQNIQTTNIPNIKFRTFAISEINRLINLCENVSE